jgi:cell division protein FtsZ
MINVRMQNQSTTQQDSQSLNGLSPKITVLGVGGAGGNAVNNMIDSGLQGCEFVVCNTDAQALQGSLGETKVQLGSTVTGGLGAGAKPEVGRAAAEETLDDVMRHLEGSNMAFITAGMGGGTGTGAAPVIAKACREKGILTVGVVTKPFHFEGTHRMKMAEEGIEQMQGFVDTLIVIPNQNLFRVANEKTTFAEAFKMADSVLQSGVRGVTDLMVMPGLINLDFADIRSAMLEMGKAMMGTGEAEGERRAVEAAESAINNPLLDDVSMKGARGVIINVTGGLDMTLFEVDEACNRIRDEVDANANIIFGSTFDEKLDGLMRVSVVATGIDAEEVKRARPVHTSTVNAVTAQQQEKKVERAQPVTEVKHAVTAATPETPSVQPKFRVPSAPVVNPSPVTTKLDEPDAEMFEQQEFLVDKKEVDSSATPKAEIYKDSFIPPQPVEAPKQEAENNLFSSPAPAEAVPATVNETEVQETLIASKVPTSPEVESKTVSSPSLTLKPPVPGHSTQQKKRAPSLFERFTSPLRQGEEEKDNKVQEDSSTGTGSTGGFSPSAPKKQVQGSLNIDVNPQSETVSEDELDIPAFLRRQAN